MKTLDYVKYIECPSSLKGGRKFKIGQILGPTKGMPRDA